MYAFLQDSITQTEANDGNNTVNELYYVATEQNLAPLNKYSCDLN